MCLESMAIWKSACEFDLLLELLAKTDNELGQATPSSSPQSTFHGVAGVMHSKRTRSFHIAIGQTAAME